MAASLADVISTALSSASTGIRLPRFSTPDAAPLVAQRRGRDHDGVARPRGGDHHERGHHLRQARDRPDGQRVAPPQHLSARHVEQQPRPGRPAEDDRKRVVVLQGHGRGRERRRGCELRFERRPLVGRLVVTQEQPASGAQDARRQEDEERPSHLGALSTPPAREPQRREHRASTPRRGCPRRVRSRTRRVRKANRPIRKSAAARAPFRAVNRSLRGGCTSRSSGSCGGRTA